MLKLAFFPSLRGEFIRHVAALGSGTAIGQMIVVAVTPLLTRLYSPEDLGLFGLFASFLTFAVVAVNLRFDFAILSVNADETALSLLALCLIVSPFTGLLLSGLLLGLIHNEWLGFGLLPVWSVPLVFLALVATGVFVALRYWQVSRQRFANVGRVMIVQGAARASLSVVLGTLSFGWVGLAIGEVFGRISGIRGLWKSAGPELRGLVRSGRLTHPLTSLRRAWRYPAVVLPSSLLDALAAALPLPIIAWLFGPTDAGQFALVTRVAAVPGALISASVADVFHTHAAAEFTRGTNHLQALLVRTMGRLALAAVGIFAPLCLLSLWAFGWVFGAEWDPAGQLMALLAPLWITSLVVSPVSRLPMVIGRPALKLVFDACFLVLPVISLFAFARGGMRASVLAYGLAASLAFGLFAVLLYVAAGRTPPPVAS